MLDCAVIGAGLAGLSAARRLVSRGLQVQVLEARDRVGGRVENGLLDDGQYVELGGQWIGAGHDRVLELADEFGLAAERMPSRGNLVVRLRGTAVPVPSSEEAELSPFEVSDLSQGVLRLRRLAQRLQSDAVWAEANHVWLGQPLARWVQTNLRTGGGQRRFSEVYRAAFGAAPDQASLLEGLRQINSGPELERLLASNGGLNQMRLEGGMFRLCEAMAEELGDVVRLASPVTRVEYNDESATLVLADGGRIEARRVICTLPPRLAAALEFDPPLPAWRAEAAEKISQGNVIKAFLVYETPFWRNDGLSGHSSADEGAVRVTFDTTTGENQRGLLMGFFEGAAAESLGPRTPTLRQRAFIDSAVRSFGQAAAHPVGYLERDWSAEEYTRGCHGAHFAPGVWSTNGPVLAQPEGIIHWAGAEYATRFNGYMEGAVRSGEQVAATLAKEWA